MLHVERHRMTDCGCDWQAFALGYAPIAANSIHDVIVRDEIVHKWRVNAFSWSQLSADDVDQ